jgi:UDP-glucuronate decarboxylase
MALPDLQLVDVRELVDGPGNSAGLVRAKIDEGVAHLRAGRRVVVGCEYGISRSNAVAAGILRLSQRIPFDAAVAVVLARTGEVAMDLDVIESVRCAVAGPRSGDAGSGLRRTMLVTGGSGFIGSALLPLLRTAYTVLAPSSEALDVSDETVRMDLIVKRAGVDALVHLAQPGGPATASAMARALQMLKNVLDVSSANRLHFVFLSRPPGTAGIAGMTSVLAERLVAAFAEHRGVPSTVLRCSTVYGPPGAGPRFLRTFLEQARRHQEIVTHRYRNGLPLVDLLHVDDLCSAILRVVEQRHLGTLEIGSGLAMTTAKIAQVLVRRLGSRSTLRQVDVDTEAPDVCVDIEAAGAALGWRPAVTPVEGLHALVRTPSMERIAA